MDDIELAHYRLRFENEFHTSKGDAFQSFFNKLMTRAYKEDYMPCRPWGTDGDQKNDGFLRSEKCLFQVYAPNEMNKHAAIKKIEEDFSGAKKYWAKYFDKWVFVHNAHKGLPPHVQEKILELERENPEIKLRLWSLEELLEILKRLKRQDLESWFGKAPSLEAKRNLGFEDLRVVLETIAGKKPDPNSPVKEVPPRKIEENQLSHDVETLLKAGMSKAPLVDAFFSRWHDEKFGARLAKSFKEQYEEFRDRPMAPNRTFDALRVWAGGSERGSSEHEMAVLTVMAYYFERCTIFEDPRSV